MVAAASSASEGSSTTRRMEASVGSHQVILRSVPVVTICNSSGWMAMALKYVEPKKETRRTRLSRSHTMHEPSSDAVTADTSPSNKTMSFTVDRCSFMDACRVMTLKFRTCHNRTFPSEPPLMTPHASFIPLTAVTRSCALAATKSAWPVSM